MLSRDQILNEFTDNYKAFKLAALNIAGEQDADDLFQEVSLMLLEFSEERLQSYYNPTQGLKPIFLRMLCNQYKSDTSKFHKEYRKQNKFISTKGKDIVYNEEQTEIEAVNVDFEIIENISKNIHVLNSELFAKNTDKIIFDLYVERGSLRKVLAALPADIAKDFDLKKVHEVVKKLQATYKRNYHTKVKSLKNDTVKASNLENLKSIILNTESTLKILSESPRAAEYEKQILKLEKTLDANRLALEAFNPQQA